MVIECSSCHARFKLAEDKVKESGTKVRCTKCREVFTVFPADSREVDLPASLTSPIPSPTSIPFGDDKSVQDTFPPFPNDSPVSEKGSLSPTVFSDDNEDDWSQESLSSQFSDNFSDNAGETDIDAINFDNIEPPIFSVKTENNTKLEFADESEFSFVNSQSGNDDKTSEPSIAKNDRKLDVDYPETTSSISTSNELTLENNSAGDNEFTFTPTDNLADFSWDETDSAPAENISSEKFQGAQPAPQATDFDFSSFSFDDTPTPTTADKDEIPESFTPGEGTFSLSTEAATTQVQTSPVSRQILTEQKTTSAHGTNDRHENSTSSLRHLRTRSRVKKKGPSRFILKILLFIFLVLTIFIAAINREQVSKKYKELVSRFIENQVSIETSGRFGLVKLSGGYLLNNLNENMFVIRGEAINEFKGLRSSVLVRGTIYDEKGVVLQSQSAYGGNPLKENTLKKLGFKEISYAMNNELGENLANLNIASGKSVSFAIVFNNAPKNIKEFTVEVLESKPGSK